MKFVELHEIEYEGVKKVFFDAEQVVWIGEEEVANGKKITVLKMIGDDKVIAVEESLDDLERMLF